MASTSSPGRERRTDVASLDVELADGNQWGLALPGPRLYPLVRCELDEFGGSLVRIELVRRVGYPLNVRRVWDEVVLASEGDDEARIADAFRRLILSLLHAVHDVPVSEAESLLNRKGVDLGRIARALIPVALGLEVESSLRDGR
jgi:hypothetical protein